MCMPCSKTETGMKCNCVYLHLALISSRSETTVGSDQRARLPQTDHGQSCYDQNENDLFVSIFFGTKIIAIKRKNLTYV